MPTPKYNLPLYTRDDSSALAAKFNDMMTATEAAISLEAGSPCWRGHDPGPGVVIASGAWYVISWVDTHNIGMTRIGRTISANRAGIYLVSATYMWAPNATGVRRVQLVKNPTNNETDAAGIGGTILVDQTESPVEVGAFGSTVTATTTVQLAVGDRLSAACFQTSGVSLTVALNGPVGTFFSVAMLSAL